MAAIVSNGTGGGVWSAGASWTGGVAPGEGSTAQIQSGDTITIDSVIVVGADSATPALDILSGGTVNWDGLGVADTITFKGDFYVRNGGTLTLDGTADVTKTLALKLNYSATLSACEYGMITENGAIVSLQGFNKTRSWDTLSADALATQAVCVTTNDNSAIWQTNDVIVVSSMEAVSRAYAEMKTVQGIVGTSITVTVNYTYKHNQNCVVINLTRNITITAYNAAYNGYILFYNQTATNFDCDWIAISEQGANVANKYGFLAQSVSAIAQVDYCSFYNITVYGHGLSNNTAVQTYTDNVEHLGGYGWMSIVNKTITNHVALNMTTGCLYNVANSTVNGGYFCNAYEGIRSNSGLTTLAGTIYMHGNTAVSLNTITPARVTQTGSIYLDKSLVGILTTGNMIFNGNLYFGVTNANTTDVSIDGTATVVATGSNTTTITITRGSSWIGKLSIKTTTNAHKTWTLYGDYVKQSTTKLTASTNAVQFLPMSTSDEIYQPYTRIPATASKIVSYSCWMVKSSSFVTLPYIQLSGCGVTSVTATMTDSTSWQFLTVSGVATESGFCDLYVGIKETTGSVYLDDDFDSYNLWYKGDLPLTVPKSALTANDVWNVDLSTYIIGSVAGNQLRGANKRIKSIL